MNYSNSVEKCDVILKIELQDFSLRRYIVSEEVLNSNIFGVASGVSGENFALYPKFFSYVDICFYMA